MFDNKKIIGLLLSGIAIVSLIAYSMTTPTNNVVLSAVNDTGAWVGRLFSEPVNVVVRFVNSVDTLINTFEENQQLKRSIDQVDQLQVRLSDLEAENEKLIQELDLKKVLSQFDTVSATVITRNPDQWMETLVINVGSKEGVKTDMAVMSGKGMIGRIVEVNPNSSKVLLLTSQQQNAGKVSARVQIGDGKSANGIVSSFDTKTGYFKMTQIDPNAQIKVGDRVISSGLGGIIPSTLLIGEVASTKKDDYGLFQEVEIKPAGEMTDIRFVTVIIGSGNRGEE
ncbi:rod shape-determining protein MreC [Ignavigranum ruoffiae]|uniref:rod shape-determining protein MreC n=1 Tax=Ignavigranum ruoffiae TaxID=89093 RepID=UPI002354D233|nr:rod shape-determining protein MreC [Ignavigranum ruoffiae]